jgi:hypothetical protein
MQSASMTRSGARAVICGRAFVSARRARAARRPPTPPMTLSRPPRPRAGLAGARLAARPARAPRAAARGAARVAAAAGGYQWLNKEPLALAVGFAGCAGHWAGALLCKRPARIIVPSRSRLARPARRPLLTSPTRPTPACAAGSSPPTWASRPSAASRSSAPSWARSPTTSPTSRRRPASRTRCGLFYTRQFIIQIYIYIALYIYISVALSAAPKCRVFIRARLTHRLPPPPLRSLPLHSSGST